ncbi:MAG: metal-dependent hydrolase [Candidatus Thermoplasmatota archaeon]|nr:metal-dependent hydrolase [Candidatus Thermoplasmatota archaeon]
MPDLFTHSLIGWITGKTTRTQVEFVVIGALIPDIFKIALVTKFFGVNLDYFFYPIHTPIGAVLIAGLLALFFEKAKLIFILLSIGIATHFVLDLLLLKVSGGGMILLFPLSWQQWQLNLLRSDDYRMTLVAFIAAVVVYLVVYLYAERNVKQKKAP